MSKKLQAHTAWIDSVLESDKSVHKKQHHTAHRIFERLRDERGFSGCYTIVREYVALVAILGFSNLTNHGRVQGNITSRIDFACYKAGLPPLGLTATQPFTNAWSQQTRNWAFPIQAMTACSQSRRWSAGDIGNITDKVAELPGQASIPWKTELAEREATVRAWAFSLKPIAEVAQAPPVIPNALEGQAARVEELERGALCLL